MMYVREIRAGATLTVKTRIIDFDATRFHQEMIADHDGALAATAEHVQLNVGVVSRKVEPFRPEVLEKLRMARQGQGKSQARNVGRIASLDAGAPAH